MNNRHVIIFGATSAIAQAVAKNLVRAHIGFTLVGRDSDRLNCIASDLQTRGAQSVVTFTADLGIAKDLTDVLPQIWPSERTVELVLVAQGILPDESKCVDEPEYLFKQFNINACGVMTVAQAMADKLVKQGSGSLAVISSVAGDRGRQSNYNYGSAKAAVNIFVEGLRHRHWFSPIHILTVKPGFVDTPMTAHLSGGLLFASPEKVAKDILAAVRRKKSVAYVPGFWRFIMMLVRSIPNFLFYRTKL